MTLFFCLCECFACTYICTQLVCLVLPEVSPGSPGIGVRDGCEPLCGCWVLNLGPLQEQQVLVTIESSLHHHIVTKFLVLGHSLGFRGAKQKALGDW